MAVVGGEDDGDVDGEIACGVKRTQSGKGSCENDGEDGVPHGVRAASLLGI